MDLFDRLELIEIRLAEIHEDLRAEGAPDAVQIADELVKDWETEFQPHYRRLFLERYIDRFMAKNGLDGQGTDVPLPEVLMSILGQLDKDTQDRLHNQINRRRLWEPPLAAELRPDHADVVRALELVSKGPQDPDRYAPLGYLGEGGYGVIYAIYDGNRGKHGLMAVKFPSLLRADVADEESIETIRGEGGVVTAQLKDLGTEAEADMLERFRYDRHFPRIDARGTTSRGTPYFLTEHLRGETLGSKLRRKRRGTGEKEPDSPFEKALAVQFAYQAAEALVEMHKLGLGHFDVKPDNLFVIEEHGSEDGVRVVLLDLGLAKRKDSNATSSFHGTMAYLAPELLLTEHVRGDQSDVFSLGVTLYELVRGYRPFDSELAERLVQVENLSDVKPIPDVDERLTLEQASLWQIFAKMCKANPADRLSIGTAASMLQSWIGEFGLDDDSKSKQSRRALMSEDGVYVWTREDTVQEGDDQTPPDDWRDYDHASIREGYLPDLRQEFGAIRDRFIRWLTGSGSEDRTRRQLPIFWIADEEGAARAQAQVAATSVAVEHGALVLDAGADMAAFKNAARFVRQLRRTGQPPVIAVRLEGTDEKQRTRAWNSVFSTLNQSIIRGEDNTVPRILCAGTKEQAKQLYSLATKASLTLRDSADRSLPKLRSHENVNTLTSESLGEGDVYNQGLPLTDQGIVGREGELGELDRAWLGGTRVYSLVASGGTGKSAIANEWLRRLREKDYLGAQKMLAWSFYSQGTKDNLVSADLFVDFALDWFGNRAARSLNPTAKGRTLAALIKKHKTLLVLDGMEPLQLPLSEEKGGSLTDDSIRALLSSLAQPDWDGMCLVTTRVPLTDLRDYEPIKKLGTFESKPLDDLSPEAAGQLLERLTNTDGAEPTAKRLEDCTEIAEEEAGRHALAVTLLGNYLREFHGGNLAGVKDLVSTEKVKEGGHARRVMESYARWFRNHGAYAELRVLRVIGLFDRPADPDAIDALFHGVELEGPLEDDDRVGGDRWEETVARLRLLGLLNSPIEDRPDFVDAHPLVREHFRKWLKDDDPEGWVQGNSVLYGYFQGLPEKKPDNAQGMDPLYASVTHGCEAGLHGSVYEDVLLPRIWRDRRTSYSTRRLGLTGQDLAALSHFFENTHGRWRTLKDVGLSDSAQVLILTNAGVRLRQLGRLEDARRCFGAAVKTSNQGEPSEEDFMDAAYAAAQYTELLVIGGYLTGGEPDEGQGVSEGGALATGEIAIEFADRAGKPYFRMHARSSLAEVYFMLGQRKEAMTHFQEAIGVYETAVAELGPEHRDARPPFLYSQSLFRYGYFSIEADEEERARWGIGPGELLADAFGVDWIATPRAKDNWGRNGEDTSRLSRAIRSQIVGAAQRQYAAEHGHEGVMSRAEDSLKDALDLYREAGYADYLVRGLLEEARFRRTCRKHFAGVRDAEADGRKLDEALEIAAEEAKRSQMGLLEADIALERTAARLDEYLAGHGDPDQVRAGLADLRERVEEIGYGRRGPELEALEAAFQTR